MKAFSGRVMDRQDKESSTYRTKPASQTMT